MSKSRKPKSPATGVATPIVETPQIKPSKIDALVALLCQDGGVTLAEMQAATGWQAHSVRGALSGTIARRRGLAVTSRIIDEQRRYFIDGGA